MRYKTRVSDSITSNHSAVVEACYYALRKFRRVFPDSNSTMSTTTAERQRYGEHEGYRYYNVFSAAAPSPDFYKLFIEMTDFIFEFSDEDHLYVQAWLNCQRATEVLDWHKHSGYLMHGYICIDPKDTRTEFESFQVENSIGLMYIGECRESHRVVSSDAFEGDRITIGFDVIRPSKEVFDNLGFVPIYRRDGQPCMQSTISP